MVTGRKSIEGSEVWRGGAGVMADRTSPMKRQGEPAGTYMRHDYTVWIEREPEGSEGITLSGMVNAPKGRSDVCLWIPSSGFADVLTAMMKTDPDATWAAIRTSTSHGR